MLVVDTAPFLYDALDPSRLSRAARAAIEAAAGQGELAVVDVTLWEVAMLVSHGRLDVGGDTLEFLRAALRARAIQVLQITPEIAVLSTTFGLHGDPADRLIAAASVQYRARLVTPDRALRRARGLVTVW
ncbi:MAG: type II toxin-antitoxin system VapC family toxin [bacterium]